MEELELRKLLKRHLPLSIDWDVEKPEDDNNQTVFAFPYQLMSAMRAAYQAGRDSVPTNEVLF